MGSLGPMHARDAHSATALFAEAVYEAELDDAIQAAEALIANATGINRTASSPGTASTSDNSTSKQATEVASDGAAPEGMRESALVIAEDSIRRGNVQTCLGLLYDVRLAMVAGGLVGANASVRSTYNLPAILAEPSKTPYMFAGVASHSEWENFVLIAHPYLPTGFSFGEVFASSSETWGEWYGAGTTFDRWIAQVRAHACDKLRAICAKHCHLLTCLCYAHARALDSV